MTLEQTRQLGIEFERRIQTMIPETEYEQKLDTETIYSYLNQYQDKFVHDIYKALDNIPTPSKPSAYVERIIQGLLTDYCTDVDKVNNMYEVYLPDDFGLYVNSTTFVEDSYSYKNTGDDKHNSGMLPNALVSKTEGTSLIQRPQDNMRILRSPIAYLNTDDTIIVIVDRYTNPVHFKMSYYRTPKYMDLFDSKPCELPMDVFDDLVTGAVDLYVQYVAGAEARKRQMAEQQRQARKEDNNDRR